jgi:hypothetical protein
MNLSVTLLLFVLLLSGCGKSVPRGYDYWEGDVLFQSLPHAPLVDAIEGVTKSPYSHCGIVTKHGNAWFVLEAIGPVRETPLPQWVQRGRGRRFVAYRLDASFSTSIPGILAEGRKFLGRPYDIHYKFDDEKIYCSELVFKAIQAATGRTVGKVQRIGDLNWKPHEDYIRSIEGRVPLDRELISPQALSEAKELAKVYESAP